MTFNRNAPHQMIQTDLRYRFHNQHLPLTPSVQRQGAFMGTNHGGSILDADHIGGKAKQPIAPRQRQRPVGQPNIMRVRLSPRLQPQAKPR